MITLVRCLVISLACLSLVGCGYQLGSVQVASGQTIAVPTFVNKTSEPDLETRITNAVIRRMQVDGTYKVVGDPSQADFVLLGELISYQRDAISFDRSDVTREYRTTLAASLIFQDGKTGEEIWKVSRVEGEVIFPRGSDQAEAERAAFPELTGDLAKFIVEKTVNQGW
jgi:outer membrane lipopolysaccharide assembly protein LptE/RlpB